MDIVDLPWLPQAPEDFRARLKGIDISDPGAIGSLQALANASLQAAQAQQLGKAIRRHLAMHRDERGQARLRLAILASATFDFVLDHIQVSCLRRGVLVEIDNAPHDQIIQRALDARHGLLSRGFDVVLLAIDHRWLGFDQPVRAPERAAELLDAAEAKLRAAVEAIHGTGGPSVILTTVAAPPLTAMGSLDRSMAGSLLSLTARINEVIVALAAKTQGYVLDVAAMAHQVGTMRWFDEAQWHLYKLPFGDFCVPLYADRLGALIAAIRGRSRKCLVLDLDNTMWGGVIGDDGLEGLRVGQGSAEGEAFLAVQRYAKSLQQHGIILAVCSKNDEANALLPFREHPDMVLKEDDFAAFRANWIDKASNIEAIAKALNIGLDSLVFLDDNPAERYAVRAALPMVAVPELTNDSADYVRLLSLANYFEAVSLSDEDVLRARSYADDKQRSAVMRTAENIADYLGALEMVISFAPFDAMGLSRIAQLINKSNQFNLTTRRYTEADVAQLAHAGDVFTLQVRLADKFGDSGMIGVIIARPAVFEDGQAWDIDTWLMSCRVLGRRVEEAMLSEVVYHARQAGVEALIGRYVPTAKNGMVADHYRKLGFGHLEEQPGGAQAYLLRVAGAPSADLPFTVKRTGWA